MLLTAREHMHPLSKIRLFRSIPVYSGSQRIVSAEMVKHTSRAEQRDPFKRNKKTTDWRRCEICSAWIMGPQYSAHLQHCATKQAKKT